VYLTLQAYATCIGDGPFYENGSGFFEAEAGRTPRSRASLDCIRFQTSSVLLDLSLLNHDYGNQQVLDWKLTYHEIKGFLLLCYPSEVF